MKREKGFTLLELLVVIAIMAILATFAVPNYNRFMAKTRMNALMGEWRDSFYLAQSEALRLKHQITLCSSSDGTQCAADSKDYTQGWIIYDENSKTVIRDVPPPVKEGYTMDLSLGIGQKLTFLNNGRFAGSTVGVTFTIKSEKYKDLESSIVINGSGRISPKTKK